MKLGYFVKKASKSSVINGVRHIKKYQIPYNKILSSKNRIGKSGYDAIRKHSNAQINYSINNTEVKTYLAAAALSHMLDGWMYLSNAFDALLNGDEGSAIHLSYYAELRSAMSILATEGIGVFDKKHLGIFEHNNMFVFNFPRAQNKKNNTHQFVWNAMEKWSNSAYKPDADILKIFKVKGKDFYEIIEFFHPSISTSTILTVQTVKDWLKEWCFDIRTYIDDRDARNEVSYRPQRIKNFNDNIDFATIITTLNSYWNALSPSSNDKFSTLDTYLLKKLLNNLYTKLNTTTPFVELVENAFGQHGIYDKTLFDFLDIENPNSEHSIFRNANLHQTTSLTIIARATLLLRVSVGLVSQLYKDGGVTKEELHFVWQNYGVDNGFWSPEEPYSDFTKLWSSISTSFADLREDISSSGDNSIYAIKERNPKEVMYLGQINRACLWGLDF